MNQIVLIAESKTMSAAQMPVTADEYATRHPAGEEAADRIMAALRAYSSDELAEMLKVSPALARSAQRYIYGFADKTLGLRTCEAYTGVVFKAFGYSSLDTSARNYANEHLFILSSLYGLLRLTDIIKPYRLDYTARTETRGATLWSQLRAANTAALCRIIRDRAVPAIINLLPADASKSIDWKSVKELCPVVTPDFRIPDGKGGYRTPNARRLKELRGLMCRDIMQQGIPTPEALRDSLSENCLFIGHLKSPDRPAFLAD